MQKDRTALLCHSLCYVSLSHYISRSTVLGYPPRIEFTLILIVSGVHVQFSRSGKIEHIGIPWRERERVHLAGRVEILVVTEKSVIDLEGLAEPLVSMSIDVEVLVSH